MAKSKSSHRWLKEHFNDEYVKRAQRDGYPSRALHKLDETQQRDRLIKPGMTLVDLGAAPGGWSQNALPLIGRKGKVRAMDILTMDPLHGVDFMHSDYREDDVLESQIIMLDGREIVIELSAIDNNITEEEAVDMPGYM